MPVRDQVRGFAEGTFESASPEELARLASDLGELLEASRRYDQLRQALADPSVPLSSRRAIASEIMAMGAAPLSGRVVSYTVAHERAPELFATLEWLRAQARTWAAGGRPPELEAEAPSGRTAWRERAVGYAHAVLSGAPEAVLAEVEEELFGLTRVVEASGRLAGVLTDAQLPARLRSQVMRDLLAGRAHPQTVSLATYAVGAGRPRDPVAALSWMAEQAAAERNLRIAQVRSARPLDPDQQQRLASALSRRVDRPVELRVTLDPSLIGGVVVLVGDIVVDASLRRRLDQLRQALSEATYTGASERS